MNIITIVSVALIGSAAISAKAASDVQTSKTTIFLLQEASLQTDEFKAYRAEQEKKIEANEKKIAELKERKNKVKAEDVSDYNSKIDMYEKRNNELKKKIRENRKDESKEKWESFKKEYSHDMDELGNSIKGMFKDDVK